MTVQRMKDAINSAMRAGLITPSLVRRKRRMFLGPALDMVWRSATATVLFDKHERDYQVFLSPRITGVSLWHRRVNYVHWLNQQGITVAPELFAPNSIDRVVQALSVLDGALRRIPDKSAFLATLNDARKYQRWVGAERKREWGQFWSNDSRNQHSQHSRTE